MSTVTHPGAAGAPLAAAQDAPPSRLPAGSANPGAVQQRQPCAIAAPGQALADELNFGKGQG
jgi:hypothetical protein